MAWRTRVRSFGATVRTHSRTAFLLSLCLDALLIVLFHDFSSVEQYPRVFAAFFAVAAVSAGALAGPLAGLGVSLLLGTVYSVFVVPFAPTESLVAGILSVVVWSAGSVGIGYAADAYRRQIARRELELREQRRLSDALNRINEVVTSRLDSSWVLQSVTEIAAKSLPADAASIALRDREGFVIAYAWNLRPELLGRRYSPADAPLAEGALLSGAVAGVSPSSAGDGSRLLLDLGHPAALVAPLLVKGEAVGVLIFGFAHGPRDFPAAELDFAGKVGTRISQSLENARLYEQQRDIAAALQESFLRAAPSVPGLEIAVASQTAVRPERVGGDFSDVAELGGGRVLLVVGDVMGKGVKATGLTETVRSSVRALATVSGSPAFILEHANRSLLDQGVDQFVTVALVVVDVANGNVTHASAGHPPPWHVSDGLCRPLDQVPGLPLGSFDGRYADTSHPTLPGDLLVLYTDGVTEAHRSGGPLFGEQRLAQTLAAVADASPRRVVRAVSTAVVEFAGDLMDDLEVLAVRIGAADLDAAGEGEAGPITSR